MIISWNTTWECHLKCKHCYRDAGAKREDELSTAEGKKLIDEIAQAGFKILILSGGEPLLREDIFELTAHAKAVGLRPVFGTTGTTITPEIAEKLKEAGALCIGISLDSIHPEIHDEFRQVPGSWQAAVDGMKNCQAVGLPFQIHTTVVDKNYHEFEAITDFAVEVGAVAHHVFFLVPTGRALDMEAEALREKQYEQLLHRILKKQREVPIELKPTCAPQFMRIARQMGMEMRFSRGCLAGTAYCCILPNGEVHPCPYLPKKVGSVKEQPFTEIWRTAEMFNQFRSDQFGGKCGTCNHKDVCSGCRARAYYYSDGDVMAEDPWCLYRRGRANEACCP
ncbi:MAG: putative heme d1 biosynthesis radical SAM protein NirJ2 [Dethiobacter sp.]|jgi:putative heme d1 biosynthesis radical SAM protein NirJ2|nr:putative heme d1 biosynthesis radical SAM protein NirJ2 [Dethiobacter sp.]MBS3902603.1 putative heme d1 biosynthesis radical SAM protein NirJ2 [Dethiobacter sp.]MBS3990108.1 putative heme d1 biosynthesis radical SAM protein NirJ2 [Dethiobacter sp.]